MTPPLLPPAAASDAAQAERAAQHFHQALGALRACREQASAARDRHAKLTAASGTSNSTRQRRRRRTDRASLQLLLNWPPSKPRQRHAKQDCGDSASRRPR